MKRAEQPDFPAFEAEMLKLWADEQTFAASLEQRRQAERFSFYDGPPFANGQPHFGHSLVTSIKDSIGRYQTMRGYYVERRNGWDCHGLPVEIAVEKELGVAGKKQIMELGLDKFNAACQASVFRYKEEWEEFFRRIGRWTDTEHAYATIDRDYTESVWWMLKQVQDKGLLYRGYKSMPYCPRCETPLSNFELNEGYRDNVPDPSVFVLFPLVDDPKTKLLAWTTTPWTLPANAALAVVAVAEYATVELTHAGESWQQGDRLILAKERLSELELRKAEYEVVKTQKGQELVGLAYEPLYDFERLATSDERREKAWHVYADPSVSLEDGTGILHVAPRYGETDLELGRREHLPLIESVDRSGRMGQAMGPFAGLFFKEADPHIVADLTARGRIFAAETFTHTYPFCYRCETPLLYFAISTWFVKVTAIKDELLKTAESINWTPEHIKQGRFGKWLEGARDWAISRNRYWGAPLPIWVNESDENDYLVVGDLDELVQLAGLSDKPEDLHRPGIDALVIERDGQTYRRVEEVFDCWFESGSMPVAQQHHPFDNSEVFQQSFPADYVGEGLDQTRLWFYVLHVLATVAFDQPAYQNVLVNGMVMAADGQKLSKRLRNYPTVEEVFATEGADALRFYLLSNDQALGAGYMRFDRAAMGDIQRHVFMTLWNSYSFLATYAPAEAKSAASLLTPDSSHILDRWLVARLNQTVVEMTKQADAYKIAAAVRPLRELIDDLSNWYVRRSRRRFSHPDDPADHQAAGATLHFALIRISQLLAPWAPFLADKLWRELTAGMDLPISVHLSDWPEAGELDAALIEQMAVARQVVTEGLAQRAAAKIKVRQPLAEAVITTSFDLSEELHKVIRDELNVKTVVSVASKSEIKNPIIKLNTQLTQELQREGLARDLIRLVQAARREAGLQVTDRIELSLAGEGELQQAITEHQAVIESETGATLVAAVAGAKLQTMHLDGAELQLSLRKTPNP